jgi:hypothetical protein
VLDHIHRTLWHDLTGSLNDLSQRSQGRPGDKQSCCTTEEVQGQAQVTVVRLLLEIKGLG